MGFYQGEFSLNTRGRELTNLPLAILVNENTASAAEIFVGAMQDYRRARVVGGQTFGKGSMQTAFQAWDNAKLYLFRSTHLIVRPSGLALQRLGITPDINIQIRQPLRESTLYANALPTPGEQRQRILQPLSPCAQSIAGHLGDDSLSIAKALLQCRQL